MEKNFNQDQIQQQEVHPLIRTNMGSVAPPEPGFAIPPATPYPANATTTPAMGDKGSWMDIPQTTVSCPTGLEYLTKIDQLIVFQTLDLMEVATGYDNANRFYITNSLGNKVYYAREESNHCARYCCGARRPFELKIFNNFGQHILNLVRPLACQSCWCPCCLQTMEVIIPPGNLIGTIEQEWSVFYPSFTIRTPGGQVVLNIKGPLCTWRCCSDINFTVYSADRDVEVGKISKKWSDYSAQGMSEADVFGISFPMDLDVKMKAVMLGACFLIDMMYFKRAPTAKVVGVR